MTTNGRSNQVEWEARDTEPRKRSGIPNRHGIPGKEVLDMTADWQPIRRAWADPRPDAPYAALVHTADLAAFNQPRARHGFRRMAEWYECRCDVCIQGMRDIRARRYATGSRAAC